MNKILIFTLFFMNSSIFLQASTKKTRLTKLPRYHAFRKGQKITYQDLPNDIQRQIANYAGLNEPDSDDDWTKLQAAAFDGDFEQVQLLTILGVDLDKTTPDNQETALMHAIETYEIIHTKNEIKNKYNIAKYLILHGADVNKPDEYQNTPLDSATNFNNMPIFKLLLQANAHTNNQKKSKRTPSIQDCKLVETSLFKRVEKPFFE